MKHKYSELRERYLDEVLHLYLEEGLSCYRIAKIIPVSRWTLLAWIRNFADDKKVNQSIRVKAMKKKEGSTLELLDTKQLQQEVMRLRDELLKSNLRAEAYNELINVAEKQFKISIRKKAGTKQ